MTFYRRNLPHWHPEGKSIFITWRLFGSLPASLLKKNRTARNGCATTAPESEDFPGKKFLELDAALDSAKRGPCWLAAPEFAAYAEYPILHGADLGRYQLHAYAVMPNHVHLLITPRTDVPRLLQKLKGTTARQANQMLGRTGAPFWQDENYDHPAPNSQEFGRIESYIVQNPVRAGSFNRRKNTRSQALRNAAA